MEKEISAINDIRKFINVLNDNLTDKMQENTNKRIKSLKTRLSCPVRGGTGNKPCG